MLEPLCAEQKEVNCIDTSQELAAALELPDRAGAIVVWISQDGLALEWRWLNMNKAKHLRVPVASRDESAATSLAWCRVKSQLQPLLCVGFRHGGITLFTHEGDVLLSFLLAASPVLRIRACAAERHTLQEECGRRKVSDQLMLLHDHGLLILVSLDSLSESEAPDGVFQPNEESLQDLQFEVFELRGRAGIVDACTVLGARSLEDPFSIVRGGFDSIAVVALGSQPFLSLHHRPASRASGGSGRSLMATAFALGSYARSWVLRKPTDSLDDEGECVIALLKQTSFRFRAKSQPQNYQWLQSSLIQLVKEKYCHLHHLVESKVPWCLQLLVTPLDV
eukprot:symbB.v1.2.025164.t1/scaffold2343.1/size81760/5